MRLLGELAVPQTFWFRVPVAGMVASVAKQMFKDRHSDRSVILLCVRCYFASSPSSCDREEMMIERGISVDHATMHRWVVRYSPELLERFNRSKRWQETLALACR